MEITVAELDDIPELCELLNVLFNQEAEFSPDSRAQARGLAAIINEADVGDVLVAREDGRILAMVNLLYSVSTALGGRVALLEDMVVSPDARGGGVGSSLITHAIARAKERNCKRITLLTDGDNHRAQAFYARHGFSKSGMTAFRLPLDNGENV